MKFLRGNSAVHRAMKKTLRRRQIKGVDYQAKCEENRTALLASLPTCTQASTSPVPCKFRKVIEEQQRCGAASFCSTSCEYLGAVEPLKRVVAEEKKEKKRRTLIIEAPPED